MPLAHSRTRQTTVRLPVRTYERLRALAVESDRQVAQLVRYALLNYLPDDPSEQPVNLFSVSRLDGETKHLSVRLPEALADAVDAAASAYAVTASDIIREAIETWLPTVTVSSLGNPVQTTRIEG